MLGPHRVEIAVNQRTDRLANIRRPQNRQHQIGAGIKTPLAEGLAKVAVVPFQAGFAGDIETTQQSDGRIDQYPAGVGHRIDHLALQKAVDADENVVDVGKHIADTIARRFRHHRLVAGRDRSEERVIDAFVEAEHGAIEAFKRIAGRGRRCASASERRHQQEQANTTALREKTHFPSLLSLLPSAALSNTSLPIRSSSTSADEVDLILSPGLSFAVSPPGDNPMYCSPSKPEV